MSSTNLQIQFITAISLAIFALLLIGIGFYSKKKANTMDGFLLGGRKIGAWMSAFAYGTAYFSAVIFIGYAGKQGWDLGLSSVWIGVGNAVLGCFLSWLVLAKRTRNMSHNLNASTMPEFFCERYESTYLKLFSAVIIFVFLVPYSAAVYKGLGALFNTIFPQVSVNVCMLIVAVITSIFLTLGGYVATVYTDFIQGIIMIIGVVLMLLIVFLNPTVGGVSGAISKLNAIEPALTSVKGPNPIFLSINILLTSFGTWGLPQMIRKYYAIKDEASIKSATVITTIFAALIGCGAYLVGSLGRIYLDNTLPQGGYDLVVPRILIKSMGTDNIFTTVVLAVILILLLSASMSTLSAIVLTSASAVSVDLMPFITKGIPQKRSVFLTRILCLGFAALSFIFASLKISIIVSIMSLSWGAVSGTFIGPYVWGLYSKRITKVGAWCGMLGGLFTMLGMTAFVTITQSFAAAMANAPVAGVCAMCVSTISTPLVSFMTKKSVSDSTIKKAFKI